MNLTRDEYKQLRDEAASRTSSAFGSLNHIMENSFSDNVSLTEINKVLKTAEIWTNIFMETVREESVMLSGDLDLYTNPRYNGTRQKN